MQTTEHLWPLVLEAFQAIGPHYGPAWNEKASELGMERRTIWLLLAALTLEPEPVSPALLRVRTPYAADDAFAEPTETLAEGGWLAPAGEGAYRLTDAGRQAVHDILEVAYAAMGTLEPLPPADMERLAGLLLQLVEASVAAPEPPGTWCIQGSRRTDPGVDAHPMVQIDQYMTDLNAYRDDAHLATWQPLDVSGEAWEALTFVWREGAKTAEDLATRLEYRGHTQASYAKTLEELVDRGWAVREGAGYRASERGDRIRREAEELTDHYFYAPWACLDQDETDELRGLLERLRDGLAPA